MNQTTREQCNQPLQKRFFIMMLAVVFLWGVNVIMLKYLISYFPPLALAGIRISIAALFLLPVSLWRYGPVIPPRHSWLPICGVALLSIILHQIALSWGMTATSATHSVLILGLNPILTALFACRLVNEPLSRSKVGGALLGLSGILLVVLNRADGSISSLPGDAAVLFATVMYVFGSLCVKKSTHCLPPLMVTAYSHVLGAAGLLLLGAGLNSQWAYAEAGSFWPLAVLFFSGWICTGLATIGWNTGIHHIGASTAALFLNGQPIVGVFGSALLLGEPLIWQHYAALLLVIIGVSLGTGAVRLLPGKRLIQH